MKMEHFTLFKSIPLNSDTDLSLKLSKKLEKRLRLGLYVTSELSNGLCVTVASHEGHVAIDNEDRSPP